MLSLARLGLMAALAATASDYAHLTMRSQELKRQTRELKAQRKGDARKQARTSKRLFSVALCVLAVSGSRVEVLEKYWRRCAEDEAMVEKRKDEVITHFLAMEPVAVAAILDAERGPGAVVLKKALAFILEDETLTWVRSQNREKGIAPARENVLQAREKLRLTLRRKANPAVSGQLQLRTKTAGYKWASRWRRAWGVLSGAFHARKVISPAVMLTKAWGIHSVAQ